MSAAADLFRRLARESGVSSASVTMALQDSPRIGLKTKERVFRVSRKLGYRASRIRGRHQMNFAVFFGQSLPTSRLSDDADVGIWEGISRRAMEAGVSMYTHSVHRRPGPIRFGDLPALLRRDQCDGVILMGACEPSFVRLLGEFRVPFVIAGNADVAGRVNQVRIDLEQGIHALVRSLVARGHKRCGFITSGADLPVNRQMFRAWKDATREARIFDPRLVARSRTMGGDGIALAASLLKRRPAPTVVFATRKGLATEVAIAAARRGLVFDSGFEIATEFGADVLRLGYPLHVVRSDPLDAGARVLDRLLQLAENPVQSPVTLTLACALSYHPPSRA